MSRKNRTGSVPQKSKRRPAVQLALFAPAALVLEVEAPPRVPADLLEDLTLGEDTYATPCHAAVEALPRPRLVPVRVRPTKAQKLALRLQACRASRTLWLSSARIHRDAGEAAEAEAAVRWAWDQHREVMAVRRQLVALARKGGAL